MTERPLRRHATLLAAALIVAALLPVGPATAQPVPTRADQVAAGAAVRVDPTGNRYATPAWPSPEAIAADPSQSAAAVWGDVALIGTTSMVCSTDPADYTPTLMPTVGHALPAHRAQLCEAYSTRPASSLGVLTNVHDPFISPFLFPELDTSDAVLGPDDLASAGWLDSRNNTNFMRYVDADTDPSTFSSSAAAWIPPTRPYRIVHARLSWFGWLDGQASLWPGDMLPTAADQICGPDRNTPFDRDLAGAAANGLAIRPATDPADADGHVGLVEEMANAIIDPTLMPFGLGNPQCPSATGFSFGSSTTGIRNRPVDFSGIGTVQLSVGGPGSYRTVTADPASGSGPAVEVLRVGDGDLYFATADVTSQVGDGFGPVAEVPFWVANVDSIQGGQGGAGWTMSIVYEFTDPADQVEDNYNDVYVYAGPVGITCNGSGCATASDGGRAPSSLTVLVDRLRPEIVEEGVAARPSTVRLAAFDGDPRETSDSLQFSTVTPDGRLSGTILAGLAGGPLDDSAHFSRSLTGNVATGVIDADSRSRGATTPPTVGELNGFFDLLTATVDDAGAVSSDATADPTRLGVTLSTASGGEAWAIMNMALAVPRDQPGIEIDKRSDQASPVTQPGTTITYQVQVTNETALPASNVTVLDRLPADLTYRPGTATGGGRYNPATHSLEWGPLDLSAADADPSCPAPDAERDCFTVTYQMSTTAVPADTTAINVAEVTAEIRAILGDDGRPLVLTATDTASVDLIVLPDTPQVCRIVPDSYSSPYGGDRSQVRLGLRS